MENHPIPQDVTGFKFRLIGSITLKQFLYLLGAGGIDLAIYFLPIPFLIRIPLMLIPAVIALGLAFVPIDGRPMDKMIMNFLRALPGENEYIFRKRGVDMPYFAFTPPVHTRPVAEHMDTRTTQKAQLFRELSKSYFNADEEEQQGIQNVTSLFQTGGAPTAGFVNRVINADAPPAPSKAAPIPTSIAQETKHENLASPVLPEQGKNAEINQAEILSKPAPVPQSLEAGLEKPSSPVLQTQEVASVAHQTSTTQIPVATPAPQPSVSTAPQASFESPNVIEGIVRDPRGKPLPHVIVEILDENNIPKRTFRTAQNGMFVSATPMPNGTYTIHLEDTLKRQDFADKKIVVNGSILPVIEIVSVDQREKLRRELFGQPA